MPRQPFEAGFEPRITAAALKRIPPLMRLFAHPKGTKPTQIWGGVVQLEKKWPVDVNIDDRTSLPYHWDSTGCRGQIASLASFHVHAVRHPYIIRYPHEYSAGTGVTTAWTTSGHGA